MKVNNLGKNHYKKHYAVDPLHHVRKTATYLLFNFYILDSILISKDGEIVSNFKWINKDAEEYYTYLSKIILEENIKIAEIQLRHNKRYGCESESDGYGIDTNNADLELEDTKASLLI